MDFWRINSVGVYSILSELRTSKAFLLQAFSAGDGFGELHLSSVTSDLLPDATQSSELTSRIDVLGEGSGLKPTAAAVSRPNSSSIVDRGHARSSQRSEDPRPVLPLSSSSSEMRTRGVLSSVSEESDQSTAQGNFV